MGCAYQGLCLPKNIRGNSSRAEDSGELPLFADRKENVAQAFLPVL
jgi:hypothetical protein